MDKLRTIQEILRLLVAAFSSFQRRGYAIIIPTIPFDSLDDGIVPSWRHSGLPESSVCSFGNIFSFFLRQYSAAISGNKITHENKTNIVGFSVKRQRHWIPAFAGMTDIEFSWIFAPFRKCPAGMIDRA